MFPLALGLIAAWVVVLAEALIALNMATIFREAEFALDPPDSKLKTKQKLGLQPLFKFRLMRPALIAKWNVKMPTKKPQTRNVDHPNTPAPLRVWARLLWGQDGVRVAPQHRERVRRILIGSAMMVPMRLIEKIRYGRTVARTKIAHPPIFIIGHARTGTTHLHYLLTRDPQFATVSMFQSVAPTFFSDRPWLDQAFHGQAARSETSAG